MKNINKANALELLTGNKNEIDNKELKYLVVQDGVLNPFAITLKKIAEFQNDTSKIKAVVLLNQITKASLSEMKAVSE